MNSSSTNPSLIGPDAQGTSAFFRRKKLTLTLIFVGLALLSFGAGRLTDFKVATIFTAVPRVVVWMLTNFVPDARALDRLPHILDKLVETVLMSISASVAAALVSLFLALLGSRTTRVHPFFSGLTRAMTSIIRNIPIVAWALVFLLTFGQSSFSGFLALFFVTFGFLTRAFTETIDEVAASPVEALTAAGSSRSQVIVHAVFPSSMPQILSWLLYMIETNIRSAALVGLLTGSGIGFVFDLYYKSMQYKAAALVVVSIVVVTLAIEMVSNALRRIIL